MNLLLLAVLLATEPTPDELCAAIGETSAAVIQPRDRIFFKKNCTCTHDFGCAANGSPFAAQNAERQARLDKKRGQVRATLKKAEVARQKDEADQRAAIVQRLNDKCPAALGNCQDEASVCHQRWCDCRDACKGAGEHSDTRPEGEKAKSCDQARYVCGW